MTTMKRILFLLAPALLLGACTSEVTDGGLPEGSGPAIAFQVPDTRRVVENFVSGDKFAVWGGYDNNATNVFNGKTVRLQAGGAWTYEGLQYWISGETYNFYAVYPTNVAVVSEDGTITVKDFDASKTGDKAVDLMTAEAKDIDGANAPVVAFSFRHLLSRVNIQVISEGGDATIESASLSGIYTKGNYNSNGSPAWSLTDNNNSFEVSDYTPASTSFSLFGDMLLLPQAVSGFVLSISYDVDGTFYEKNNIPLPTDISQWEAGRSYTYTLTLSDGQIIFGKPSVSEWDEASGGIIIVD